MTMARCVRAGEDPLVAVMSLNSQICVVATANAGLGHPRPASGGKTSIDTLSFAAARRGDNDFLADGLPGRATTSTRRT
jgi:hypothetical protein